MVTPGCSPPILEGGRRPRIQGLPNLELAEGHLGQFSESCLKNKQALQLRSPA